VVIERAARSFDLARAFQAVDARSGANMLVENERISENLFDFLDAVECLNQPRVVIVEGAFDGPLDNCLNSASSLSACGVPMDLTMLSRGNGPTR